jgi:hypothetical protein
MDVDVAEAGKIKHPLRDNPPIRDDDDGVWSNGFQLSTELKIILDALRLENKKTEANGELLNRGNL